MKDEARTPLVADTYIDVIGPEEVRIRGTRIDLSVLVEAYLEGRLPEQIVLDDPSLSLELVHGALASYLRHQEAVDRYTATVRKRSTRDQKRLRSEPEPAVVTRLRIIDGYRLPVTHDTSRRGSPYTLVLEKTKALFAREKAARKSLQRALTCLRKRRKAFGAASPARAR